MICKQCGYGIVHVEFYKFGTYMAQQNGFCSKGCEKVHEVIKEIQSNPKEGIL